MFVLISGAAETLYQTIRMSSFLDLPDELILKVFSYTEIADLWKCGRVSKRIRNISIDNSLIPKLNLMDLPDEVILKVLSYTKIADILSCCQVSKRFRNIYDDDSLLSNSQLINVHYLDHLVPLNCIRVLNLLDAKYKNISSLLLKNVPK